jgi:3-oxoadipate enol-lactonase
MPRTKVGDINIYYETHGRGEPLVMVCGASATTESYTLLAPLFSRQFRVVLFDNRGTGQTDAPDILYSTGMMADDLAGLLDFLGIYSVHIYGQSMGGMIAQEFALRYPERVKSLVLQSTYCGGTGSLPINESKRFNPELRPKMTLEELGRETLQLCVTPGFMDKHPNVARRLMEAMMKQSLPVHGALRQAQAVKSHDTYQRLPEIILPTLVLAGDEDAAMPVENSRMIAARVPQAELVIFKGAGHILIEAGHEPYRVILDFLKRHRGDH